MVPRQQPITEFTVGRRRVPCLIGDYDAAADPYAMRAFDVAGAYGGRPEPEHRSVVDVPVRRSVVYAPWPIW